MLTNPLPAAPARAEPRELLEPAPSRVGGHRRRALLRSACRRRFAMLLLAAGMIGAAAAAEVDARPPVERVVHAFTGSDGAGPVTGLVVGDDSNLYGTSYTGGSGLGTVFRLSAAGRLTVLHRFGGSDGALPAVGLVAAADGDFYGLTSGGGAANGGTAYRISKTGVFTLLHAFDPATEGYNAYLGALVQGADGNFYGVNSQGGPGGRGVAFRMTPGGSVTVLHAFSGLDGDGISPIGGLVPAGDGGFYGATLQGGLHGGGTLYRLDTSGELRYLYHFSVDTPAPAFPQAAPVPGPDGFLYGSTGTGGAHQFYGTVYKVRPDGQGFAVLHDFAGGVGNVDSPNSDGWSPIGSLVLGGDGSFYGVTSEGGTNTTVSTSGDGIVFRVSPAGDYAVAHAFGASAQDGSGPAAGLVQRGRFLFGTTRHGGTGGEGTVFSLMPR